MPKKEILPIRQINARYYTSIFGHPIDTLKYDNKEWFRDSDIAHILGRTKISYNKADLVMNEDYICVGVASGPAITYLSLDELKYILSQNNIYDARQVQILELPEFESKLDTIALYSDQNAPRTKKRKINPPGPESGNLHLLACLAVERS